MELKTIAIVDHDHVLRGQICAVLQQKLPGTIVREYTLSARVLAELKQMNLDLMITGNELLDSDGETLARAARCQMALLPIITLVNLHEPPSKSSLKLHSCVPKIGVEELLVPAILALLHNDSWVRNMPAAADPGIVPSDAAPEGRSRSGTFVARKVA